MFKRGNKKKTNASVAGVDPKAVSDNKEVLKPNSPESNLPQTPAAPATPPVPPTTPPTPPVSPTPVTLDPKETPKKEEPVVSQSSPQIASETVAAAATAEPISVTDQDIEFDEADLIEFDSKKPSKINKKLIVIVLIIVVILALAIGGFLFFKSQKGQSSKIEPTTAPKIEKEITPAIATPSAAAEEEVDLAGYTVQILNGSGVTGQAGVVEDILEKAGFEEFETDNADSFDYVETEVSLKKAVSKTVFEKIKTALKDYTVIEGDQLKEDADYDVVLIIGTTTKK